MHSWAYRSSLALRPLVAGSTPGRNYADHAVAYAIQPSIAYGHRVRAP